MKLHATFEEGGITLLLVYILAIWVEKDKKDQKALKTLLNAMPHYWKYK